MHSRLGHFSWQKSIWKLVRNPTLEVIAAILAVLVASWIVVQTEAEQRHSAFPLPFYQQ